MVLALQTMVTRSFDVFDPVVVTVGRDRRRHQGQHHPRRRRLRGDPADAVGGEPGRRCASEIERLVTGIAAAHGLTVEVDFTIGYPVTVNDVDEYAFAKETIVDLFGADRYTAMAEPEMGSEDFSFVGQQVPSAYVNLSACPVRRLRARPGQPLAAGRASTTPFLPDATALLAELALRRLSR